MSRLPTQEQVDQLRHSDQSAWTAVVTWLQPQLDGFFRAGGADDHEALTQETLLRMCRHIARFERGDANDLRAWAFAIARTTRIDMVRRAQARPQTVADSSRASNSDGDAGLEATLADPAPAPDEHLAAIDRVEHLLGQLTEQQRDLLRLRIHGDLTTEAAAATLGMSLEAAKQLQRRALRRLAQLLEQERDAVDVDDEPGETELTRPMSGTPP